MCDLLAEHERNKNSFTTLQVLLCEATLLTYLCYYCADSRILSLSNQLANLSVRRI